MSSQATNRCMTLSLALRAADAGLVLPRSSTTVNVHARGELVPATRTVGVTVVVVSIRLSSEREDAHRPFDGLASGVGSPTVLLGLRVRRSVADHERSSVRRVLVTPGIGRGPRYAVGILHLVGVALLSTFTGGCRQVLGVDGYGVGGGPRSDAALGAKGFEFVDPTCGSCMKANCSTPLAACRNDRDALCGPWQDCMAKCKTKSSETPPASTTASRTRGRRTRQWGRQRFARGNSAWMRARRHPATSPRTPRPAPTRRSRSAIVRPVHALPTRSAEIT